MCIKLWAVFGGDRLNIHIFLSDFHLCSVEFYGNWVNDPMIFLIVTIWTYVPQSLFIAVCVNVTSCYCYAGLYPKACEKISATSVVLEDRRNLLWTQFVKIVRHPLHTVVIYHHVIFMSYQKINESRCSRKHNCWIKPQ